MSVLRIPVSEYGPKNVLFNGFFRESSLSAISKVVKIRFCFNIILAVSSPINDRCPERSLSERSKSPVGNFSNHLLRILAETVPTPDTVNEFLHASKAFLPTAELQQ